MLARLALLVAVGGSIASCGGSGGSTGGSVTVGDVCTSTGTAFCDRVMACNVGTAASCLASFMSTCCDAAKICARVVTGMTAANLSAYETACDAAFKAEACADVGAETVPAACSMAP